MRHTLNELSEYHELAHMHTSAETIYIAFKMIKVTRNLYASHTERVIGVSRTRTLTLCTRVQREYTLHSRCMIHVTSYNNMSRTYRFIQISRTHTHTHATQREYTLRSKRMIRVVMAFFRKLSSIRLAFRYPPPLSQFIC